MKAEAGVGRTVQEFSTKTVCVAAEFYSLVGFLINFSLTKLTVTSNPLRKERGKHNNKTGKQHPLLHIDKRQSFAAHLQFSGITNGEIQCEMLQILDTACC